MREKKVCNFKCSISDSRILFSGNKWLHDRHRSTKGRRKDAVGDIRLNPNSNDRNKGAILPEKAYSIKYTTSKMLHHPTFSSKIQSRQSASAVKNPPTPTQPSLQGMFIKENTVHTIYEKIGVEPERITIPQHKPLS